MKRRSVLNYKKRIERRKYRAIRKAIDRVMRRDGERIVKIWSTPNPFLAAMVGRKSISRDFSREELTSKELGNGTD